MIDFYMGTPHKLFALEFQMELLIKEQWKKSLSELRSFEV
jgi:hypothetical protein